MPVKHRRSRTTATHRRFLNEFKVLDSQGVSGRHDHPRRSDSEAQHRAGSAGNPDIRRLEHSPFGHLERFTKESGSLKTSIVDIACIRRLDVTVLRSSSRRCTQRDSFIQIVYSLRIQIENNDLHTSNLTKRFNQVSLPEHVTKGGFSLFNMDKKMTDYFTYFSQSRTHKILSLILFTLVSVFIISYITIATIRLHYPYELEWCEGLMVTCVDQILAGDGAYVEPSINHVSVLYTPLYFYLPALVSLITGSGFFALRLVSFVASLGCLGFIFAIVSKETRNILFGLIATGLFAAMYGLSQNWFDVGRVDSLYIMLVLAAFYTVRFHQSTRSSVVSGVLIALAFLAKQSAVVIFAPLLLSVIWTNRRRGIVICIVAAGISVAIVLFMNILTDGWHNYYVFDIPAALRSRIVWSRFWGYWKYETLGALPLAALLATGWFVYILARKKYDTLVVYGTTLFGVIISTLLSRMNLGGFINTLIPLYAFLAVFCAFGLHSAISTVSELPREHSQTISITALAAVLLQMAFLIYNPIPLIPSEQDTAAGNQLIAEIRAIEGDVYVPSHTYYSTMAGKRPFAHAAAIRQITAYFDETDPIRIRIIDELNTALEERRFSAIIMDDNDTRINGVPLRGRYRREREILTNTQGLWPFTGNPTRPRHIYLPIPPSGTPDGID